MALIRYRPSIPELPLFPRLAGQNRIARLMEEVLGPDLPEGLGWNPPVDVVEKDHELLLSMELPGMVLEDIDIDVNESTLTIKGEKRVEEEKKEGNFRLVERSYGAFERTFTLPRSVDATAITAMYAKGVLRVTLPKTAQAVGRKVEIKS